MAVTIGQVPTGMGMDKGKGKARGMCIDTGTKRRSRASSAAPPLHRRIARSAASSSMTAVRGCMRMSMGSRSAISMGISTRSLLGIRPHGERVRAGLRMARGLAMVHRRVATVVIQMAGVMRVAVAAMRAAPRTDMGTTRIIAMRGITAMTVIPTTTTMTSTGGGRGRRRTRARTLGTSLTLVRALGWGWGWERARRGRLRHRRRRRYLLIRRRNLPVRRRRLALPRIRPPQPTIHPVHLPHPTRPASALSALLARSAPAPPRRATRCTTRL